MGGGGAGWRTTACRPSKKIKPLRRDGACHGRRGRGGGRGGPSTAGGAQGVLCWCPPRKTEAGCRNRARKGGVVCRTPPPSDHPTCHVDKKKRASRVDASSPGYRPEGGDPHEGGGGGCTAVWHRGVGRAWRPTPMHVRHSMAALGYPLGLFRAAPPVCGWERRSGLAIGGRVSRTQPPTSAEFVDTNSRAWCRRRQIFLQRAADGRHCAGGGPPAVGAGLVRLANGGWTGPMSAGAITVRHHVVHDGPHAVVGWVSCWMTGRGGVSPRPVLCRGPAPNHEPPLYGQIRGPGAPVHRCWGALTKSRRVEAGAGGSLSSSGSVGTTGSREYVGTTRLVVKHGTDKKTPRVRRCTRPSASDLGGRG